jgi:hypothetical protein
VIVLGHRNLYESRWSRISRFLPLRVTAGKSLSPTVKGSFWQSFSFAELADWHAAVLPGIENQLPKLPPFLSLFDFVCLLLMIYLQ